MKKILYIFAIILVFSNSFSKNESNIWYFGYEAGLDFSSGKPVPLTNGKIHTDEGCATICDTNGQLLFYTDGMNIWSKDHNLMPNGTGLMGNPSSTQSGVIVPCPGNPNKYYVFTVTDKSENKGFRYSVVDLTLNNGLGDVLINEKNIILVEGEHTEKVAAIRNRSCNGYWIITHDWNSTAFRSFLLTDTGIDPNSVVSKVGTAHDANSRNKIGYMKVSPDGKRIGIAICAKGIFEILDFDNITGQLTNPVTIHRSEWEEVYGLEFSPNGNLLYGNAFERTLFGAVTTYYFFQLNLNAGDGAKIANSQVMLESSDNVLDAGKEFGACQLGPDGKIYIAKVGANELAVVNKPDVAGAACNYVTDGLALSGRQSRWGLPTYIQNYFYERVYTTIPDTTASIGMKSFQIPVKARLNCGAQTNLNLAYECEIRFNGKLFMPDSIAFAEIIKNEYSNGVQTIRFKGSNIVVGSQDTTIAVIYGSVLYGDTNQTAIEITDIKWDNPQVDNDIKNGSLQLESICKPKDEYITILPPTLFSIVPNPASNDINFEIETAETGDFKIEIINQQGELISSLTKNLNNNTNQLARIKLNLKLSDVATGLFYAVLTTSNTRIAQKIILIK